MNKNQSVGMYIVLAIVILVFVSSVFMAGPVTSTSEITYSNFLERLSNNEFKKIEKADDFLIAIPKIQPKVESTERYFIISPKWRFIEGIIKCQLKSRNV